VGYKKFAWHGLVFELKEALFQSIMKEPVSWNSYRQKTA
jgi:hypothetical protein